jgi:hypothetical protein
MCQETGEILLGRNYRLPRPPSGSDALQSSTDRNKLGGRRLGQSTSSVESSRGWGASRAEAGAGPACGGSMVVRPIGAVVVIAAVEPSADVTSPWGRREQHAATSGMASLLLELQLLTSVPAWPSSRSSPRAAHRQLLAWPVLQGVCRASEPKRSKRRPWLSARLEPCAGRLEPTFIPWLALAGELEPLLTGAWSLPPLGPGDRGGASSLRAPVRTPASSRSPTKLTFPFL